MKRDSHVISGSEAKVGAEFVRKGLSCIKFTFVNPVFVMSFHPPFQQGHLPGVVSL